jgi:hypothetical protein
MARRERDILERAVHSISEQAAKSNTLIDEAMEADLPADHPVCVAKKLRLELLNVKADLEWDSGSWSSTARHARWRFTGVQNSDVSRAPTLRHPKS